MHDKVVKRKSPLDYILAFYQKNEFTACLCYFIAYTVIFCFICLVAFQSFYKNGLSFLWYPDGLTQHYNSLAYFGEYLRTIIGNFRMTGNFELPMWNFNIGYGSDIITTLHYYVIGDPLCLLSFFVKRQDTEALYNFLIIFRLYLVGASFSILGIKMKENKFGVFLGTLTYTFCMYALYTCVKHPYFINPMIYFPLLILGIEKILRKEKPYLFIFMTFISATSNFYFFYMLSILIFLYTVVRFFHKYKKKRLKMLAYHLSHFIVYYLVGVAMSAFIFLPVVIAFLSSSRITTKYNITLFYPLTYYENLLPGVISDTSAGYFTFISLSAVAFISLLLIFFQRKKYTQLKIGILVFTIFLIFPFFGHVFNGFSYVSNRWVWGISFIVGIMVIKMTPYLLNPRLRHIAIIAFISLVYFLSCCLIKNSRQNTALLSFAVLAFFLILLGMGAIFQKANILSQKKISLYLHSGLILFCLISIFSNALYRYSTFEKSYISEFIPSGEGLSILTDTVTPVMNKIEDASFYRYEDYMGKEQNIYLNSALLSGLNSTNYYFSLENGNISNFLMENSLDLRTYQKYYGLDNRMMLQALACVKYTVIKRGDEATLSSGFNKLVSSYTTKEGITYDAYKNENALPLGYTYSSYITKDRYNELSDLEKQQAMLQGVVLEENTHSIPQTTLSFTDLALNYEPVISADKNDDISFEDGKIIVKKENAKLTLQLLETMDRCETYVSFTNLQYKGLSPRECYTDRAWNALSKMEQNKISYESKRYLEPSTVSINVKSGDVSKSLLISTKQDVFHIDKENYLVNLCYNEDARKKITLTFGTPGVYTFDQLKVTAQSLSVPTENLSSLKENTLNNISIKTNKLTGTIDLSTSKILCLSIPYSSGWSAKVDGDPAKLLKANRMYMGLLLDAGSHEIELTYETPGLKAGVILSRIGFLLFIAIILFGQFREKIISFIFSNHSRKRIKRR